MNNTTYFTMLSLNKFCKYFNDNLMMFFDEFQESTELKNYEPTKYYIEKEDFELCNIVKEGAQIRSYTANRYEIHLTIYCNQNDMVFSASININNQIKEISNDIVKKFYFPFLSTITGKNLEETINKWQDILNDKNFKIVDDEFSYTLSEKDNCLLSITNIILENFIPRKEE